jgi:hypothetical protein
VPSPSFSQRHADALALVARLHAGQTRAEGVPALHHLARVSRVIQLALEATGEGTEAEREAMIIAALGHDAIEDTEATAESLRPVFGDRCVEIIVGMTSPLGDADHGPYIRQMEAAEEPVRLVKLADLYDNTIGVVYGLKSLGLDWARGFFLPLTRPMVAALSRTTFPSYPKTASLLWPMVRTALVLLDDEIARFEAAGL